jgi:hypothetical protein
MREGEANMMTWFVWLVAAQRWQRRAAELSGGGETEKEEEEKRRLAWPYIGVSDPSGVLEGARDRGGDQALARRSWTPPGGSPAPMSRAARP